MSVSAPEMLRALAAAASGLKLSEPNIQAVLDLADEWAGEDVLLNTGNDEPSDAPAPMKRESNIQKQIMIQASLKGWTVWRNNTGTAYQGNKIKRAGSTMIIENARPVRFGLCAGSSDLIGMRPVKVTTSMLGQTLAQFVAIEVKAKSGRASPAQARFLRIVHLTGGTAILARKPADVEV